MNEEITQGRKSFRLNLAVANAAFLSSKMYDIKTRVENSDKDLEDSVYLKLYDEFLRCAKILEEETGEVFLNDKRHVSIIKNKHLNDVPMLADDKEVVAKDIELFLSSYNQNELELTDKYSLFIFSDNIVETEIKLGYIKQFNLDNEMRGMLNSLVNAYDYVLRSVSDKLELSLYYESDNLDFHLDKISTQFKQTKAKIHPQFVEKLQEKLIEIKDLHIEDYDFKVNRIDANFLIVNTLNDNPELLGKGFYEANVNNHYVKNEINAELASYLEVLNKFLIAREDSEKFEEIKQDYYEEYYPDDSMNEYANNNDYHLFRPTEKILSDKEITNTKHNRDVRKISDKVDEFLRFENDDSNEYQPEDDDMFVDIEQKVLYNRYSNVRKIIAASYLEFYSYQPPEQDITEEFDNNYRLFCDIIRLIPDNKRNKLRHRQLDRRFTRINLDNPKEKDLVKIKQNNDLLKVWLRDTLSGLENEGITPLREAHEFTKVSNFLTNMCMAEDLDILHNDLKIINKFYNIVKNSAKKDIEKYNKTLRKIADKQESMKCPANIKTLNNICDRLKGVDLINDELLEEPKPKKQNSEISEFDEDEYEDESAIEASFRDILFNIIDKNMRKAVIKFNGDGEIEFNLTSKQILKRFDNMSGLAPLGIDIKIFEDDYFIKVLNQEMAKHSNDFVKTEIAKGRKLSDIQRDMIKYNKLIRKSENIMFKKLNYAISDHDELSSAINKIYGHMAGIEEITADDMHGDIVTYGITSEDLTNNDMKQTIKSKIHATYDELEENINDILEYSAEIMKVEAEEKEEQESLLEFEQNILDNLELEKDDNSKSKETEMMPASVGMYQELDYRLFTIANKLLPIYSNDCIVLEEAGYTRENYKLSDYQDNKNGLIKFDSRTRNAVIGDLQKIKNHYGKIRDEALQNFEKCKEEDEKLTPKIKFADECTKIIDEGDLGPEKYTRISIIRDGLSELKEEEEMTSHAEFSILMGKCLEKTALKTHQLRKAIRKFNQDASNKDLDSIVEFVEEGMVVDQFTKLFLDDDREKIEENKELSEHMHQQLSNTEFYKNTKNKTGLEKLVVNYTVYMINQFSIDNEETKELKEIGKKVDNARANYYELNKVFEKANKYMSDKVFDIADMVDGKLAKEAEKLEKQNVVVDNMEVNKQVFGEYVLTNQIFNNIRN